jgi:hypothetical protein
VLEEHHTIIVSTYGIVFMVAPHQGSNNAQFRKLLLNIASLIVPADGRILSDLEHDSKFLQHQLRQYSQTEMWGLVTKFAIRGVRDSDGPWPYHGSWLFFGLRW